MEKVLVLIISPFDPRVFRVHDQPEKQQPPEFGIITEMLKQEGLYSEHTCNVKLDDGTEQEYQMGYLVQLAELPEDDARDLTPSEAFAKWAAEAVLHREITRLPEAQRDWLMRQGIARGFW